jgi:hypothetical protein
MPLVILARDQLDATGSNCGKSGHVRYATKPEVIFRALALRDGPLRVDSTRWLRANEFYGQALS